MLVIDPGEADPVIPYLTDYQLVAILNTHHHADHTGGNCALQKITHCPIYAPDEPEIPCQTDTLVDGQVLKLGPVTIHVIHTPGHTKGHLIFHLPTEHLLFTGDTLFSAGCGKLFESSPGAMYQSLQKIKALPRNTKIYCGHEYTENNLKFGQTIEPDNTQISTRLASGPPYVPSTLAIELSTNVFLRAPSPDAFTTIRKKKDTFGFIA